MQSFNIEDIAGIINCIKSLDIYDQFDEIIVTTIMQSTPMGSRPDSIKISIKVDDQLILTHIEQRLFKEPKIRFDYHFEEAVKSLSSSVIFGRSLVHCIDDFSSYQIIDNSRSKLVIAQNETIKYALQVYLNDKEIAVANVLAKFKFDRDAFESTHEFKTKSSIEIEELKDVIESFEKLKNNIRLD